MGQKQAGVQGGEAMSRVYFWSGVWLLVVSQRLILCKKSLYRISFVSLHFYRPQGGRV